LVVAVEWFALFVVLFVFASLHGLFVVLQAICTEAGLLALRERRMRVTNEDFRKAKENVLYRKNEGTPEGLYL
jgi:ATP-dependent 26S proteasome regulatory subunit